MKILYVKKKFFYILGAFVFFFLLLSLYLFHTSLSKQSNTEITHKEEQNLCEEENCLEKEKQERTEFLISKYKEKKLIALTFDDGPSKYTEQLIDELKKRNVVATFFLLGENAQKWSSVIQFEIDAGNEVGIHSYKHKLFTKLTEVEINEQIAQTKFIILKESESPITLIRVPYGAINDRVEKVLDENGLKNILWTVDSKDWKFRNVDKIYRYVLKNIKGNEIILMHDIYNTSVTSALNLVDHLQAECYTFVTVSEFLEIEEIVKNSTKADL